MGATDNALMLFVQAVQPSEELMGFARIFVRCVLVPLFTKVLHNTQARSWFYFCILHGGVCIIAAQRGCIFPRQALLLACVNYGNARDERSRHSELLHS